MATKKAGSCATILWVIALPFMVLTMQAHGLPESRPLPPLPVASCALKFSGLRKDTVPAEDHFDFYISNKGSDQNSGTTASTAKSSFDGVENAISNAAAPVNGTAIGLETSSIFRDELQLSRNNIKVSSFSRDSGKMRPLISGMDVVTAWQPTQGRQLVYESVINHSIDLISPNYHYIFVAEIDTFLEKRFPLSAVRYLTLAASLDECDRTAGSSYIQPLTQNPVTVYIHPTEGEPGKNRYRYEVVKRSFAINGFYHDNGTFENLYLRSSGNGYGMLGAGYNAGIDHIIFQGGGTHHAVVKSGSLNNCLFLPGPKGVAAEISLVFYAAEGQARSNRITNSLFENIQNPLLTHTDGASSYRSLLVDSVYAFADTLNAQSMLATDNTDSVFITNSYCEGYKNFWVGLPRFLAIKNSIINKATESVIYLGSGAANPCHAEVSNTLITTNAHDGNQGLPSFQPSAGFRLGDRNTSLKVSNSIFYGKSRWHTQYISETVFNNTQDNHLEVSNNIFICDINPENQFHIMNANTSRGKGTSANVNSDYNVFVLLRGILHWVATPVSPQGDGNIFSLADWQAFTGQDRHSIVIDLRNNPAGLKAIFTDPANGNWTLTDSPQADSVRKLQAGMLTPPLYYPSRTTYEDALDQTLPGGLSLFSGLRNDSGEVKLSWKTIKEPNWVYFGVESSTDSLNFIRIADVASKGHYQDNEYTLSLKDSSLKKVYYRLRMLQTDSNNHLSPLVVVNPLHQVTAPGLDPSAGQRLTIYPNPVQSQLTVVHPAGEGAMLQIYDFGGRRLRTLNVQAGATTTTIPLPGIPAGKYILRWSDGSEHRAGTFMKVR